MKRKDWKIKSLKKDIFGKKYKKIRRLRERFLFLRKLFLRQNRYLIKKNLFANYIFYKHFLNLYKIKKQNYYYNLFFKTNIKKTSILPEYSILKNVFNKKVTFKNLKKEHEIKLIFLPNKFNKEAFGLNYYIWKLKNNNFINLKKDLETDDYKNLINLKIFDNNLTDLNIINYFFNYNLHNLCLLEIYKIIVLINLNQVKNYN